MPLPKRRHRLLTPANGIHGLVAWTVTDLNEVQDQNGGPFEITDLFKVACVTKTIDEGTESERHDVTFWAIARFQESEGLFPDWIRLGGDAWPFWTTLSEAHLPTLEPTESQIGRVARTMDGGYYVFDGFESTEEGIDQKWRRLDNVSGSGLPISWVIDPEGFPASLEDIEVSETDKHGIAYDPSGTGPHYFVLESVEYDGEQWDTNWVPLDGGGGGSLLPIKWTLNPEGFPATLDDVEATDEDRHGIAYDPSEGGPHYYVLESAVYDGEQWDKHWVALDGDDGLVTWMVDPEGFPSSLSEIDAYEEDLHKVAYVPSGGDSPRYFILAFVGDDGEGGYTRTWRPLDAPGTDITGKLDKRMGRFDWFGASRTVVPPGDFDAFHVSTNASLQTWTLPATAEAEVRSFQVMQGGLGNVRFVAGAGATVLPPKSPLQTFEQYSVVEVKLISANTWLVTGDLW